MNGSAAVGASEIALEKSSIACVLLALGLIDQAAVVVGAGIVGVELYRLVEVGERQVELLALAVHVAAPDVGDGIARIDLDRLVVVGEGEVVLPQVPLDERPVGVSLEEIGLDLDGGVEVGDCLAVPAGAAVGTAAHVVRSRVARVLGDHGRQRIDVYRRGGGHIDVAAREIGALATGERQRAGKHGHQASEPGQGRDGKYGFGHPRRSTSQQNSAGTV